MTNKTNEENAEAGIKRVEPGSDYILESPAGQTADEIKIVLTVTTVTRNVTQNKVSEETLKATSCREGTSH